MNIFLGGVHGVGKSYLAAQLAPGLDLEHTSASKLIREQRETPNWDVNKRVGDVDGNQVLLAAAVRRENDAGARLLLDGHFVLLGAATEFVPLGSSVFESLNLDAALILETSPDVIAARLFARDGRELDADFIAGFLLAERKQAQLVCSELGIPLHILNAPTTELFNETIIAMLGEI